MRVTELPVNGGKALCQIEFPVLVHRTGSIGVKLTIFIGTSLLVIEEIDPRHRQQRNIRVSSQNQFFRYGIKTKQSAVCRVPVIGVHHFSENTIERLNIRFKLRKNLFGKQFGLIAGPHIFTMVDGCGRFHIFGYLIKFALQTSRVRCSRFEIRLIQLL